MARGKLKAIIAREFAERVFTKWFAIATVFGPLVFGTLLFLPAYLTARDSAPEDRARIGIVDASGTETGGRLAANLNGGVTGDTSRTELLAVPHGELRRAVARMDEAVRDGRIVGYVVVDSATVAGRTARYVGKNATALREMNRIEEALRREVLGVRLEAAGLPAVEADRLAGTAPRLESRQLTASGRTISGRISVFYALALALLLYVTIFIYGQTVLRGVMEEKQTRVAEVVVSSVSSEQLLLGKVLGVAAVGLVQLALWAVLGYAMLRLRTAALDALGIGATAIPLPGLEPRLLAILAGFFLLGYLFYASLFATIGAVVTSEQEAQQAQIPVAMFLIISIAFLQPILAEPDGKLAVMLSIIPFSAPIIMPLRMSLVTVPVWQIVVSLLELGLGCWVAVWLAARIYRTGLLMYGKQPTLREVLRWVRAG
ncbi:MAG TPA: ABC transporter permease [Gemmatimonadaceae bacterium]|nr:ABC transporter permease [Gemmatimonadaceae bacterium]